LKLGIVTDSHLGPGGTRVGAWHNEYYMSDTVTAFRYALQRCIEEGVDGVVLLGDISNSGDDWSVETGVRLAARTGLPVWVNHDCFERVGAVRDAVRRVEARNVRLATPEGAMAEGVRVAGVSITMDDAWVSRADGRPDVSRWGDEPVVWLTHYPLISFEETTREAGLLYGDELADREEVLRPLVERLQPTIVVSGHVHLRVDSVAGQVLQLACAALVEPPFEVTLLDVERGERQVSVRVENVALVPSLTVRTPTFVPPKREWVFEAGEWRTTS
jgi:predicted phosphodiesterase